MEIVDAQVHIPRLVTDWKAGHPRVTEVDAPPRQRHGLPSVDPASWDVIITATLTAMAAAGVDALVIDEWLGQNDQGWSQPGQPVGEGAYRWNFDFSAYAAECYPEKFSFLARAHPLDPELDDVVDRLAATPGMRALRVDPLPWLPDIETFRLGGHAPVFAAAQRNGLPVMVWSSGRFLPNIEQYLRQFPHLPIILDHMGVTTLSDFELVFELGRKYDNLSVKWSTAESRSLQTYPYRDVQAYLLRALKIFGPRRLMWASDWSEHKIQHSWANAFQWILESDEISADDNLWILGRSARTTLNWPAPALYFDCATSHPIVRVAGRDQTDFVTAMQTHIAAWHPFQMSPEHMLARARRSTGD